MLTNLEIKELVFLLLDCRKKLLWLISQNPIGVEQEALIEKSKKMLTEANQFLEELHVQLPT